VTLPSGFLLAKLQAQWFVWAFQIAVLFTLLDTGVALLHGINERVATVYQERQQSMPRIVRPALSVTVMVVSVYAASAIGLVKLIAKGYGHRYAGGGYEVLQQLLLDVTGKQFPLFMKETVLKRIGMKLSTYEQPLPNKRWSQAAVAHRSSGQKVKGNWHTYPEIAAAGLWTTPTDLARFAIEIQRSLAGRSRKVLSQDMTTQMLTPQVGGWGLGFALAGEGASARFSHGGANEGFRCLLVAFKDTGQGAVVMTNSDRGSALVDEVLRSIAKEYGWAAFLPKEKVLAQVDPKIYATYAGQYE